MRYRPVAESRDGKVHLHRSRAIAVVLIAAALFAALGAVLSPGWYIVALGVVTVGGGVLEYVSRRT